MVCKNCGKELPSKVKFCTKCGKPMVESSEEIIKDVEPQTEIECYEKDRTEKNQSGFELDMIPYDLAQMYWNLNGKKVNDAFIRMNEGKALPTDIVVGLTREILNIPLSEELFWIDVSGTPPLEKINSKSAGFAVGRTGIYYQDSAQNVGKISWEQFVANPIKKGVLFYIGGVDIYITYDRRKSSYELFSALKEYILA